MSTTTTAPTRQSTVTTESGSTYRIDGDTVVLEGPDGSAFQDFTLISLGGGRLLYTDGEKVFRSSPIVDVAVN